MSKKFLSLILLLVLILGLSYFFSNPKSVNSIQNRTFFLSTSSINLSLQKQAELNYLTQLSNSTKVIIGQELGDFGWNEKNTRQNYYNIKNKLNITTKVIGFNLGWDEIVYPSLETLDLMVNFSAQGGIITFSMHPRNPVTKTNVGDRTSGEEAISRILVNITLEHEDWIKQMNIIADSFRYLEQHQVIVLFRPYHEMNGDWFWWGQRSREDYIQLWKQTHDYLTITKNLTNILWIYSPNVNIRGNNYLTDYYYPGNDYVDLINLDYYFDDSTQLNMNNSFTRVLKYHKPLVMEAGPGKNRDGSFNTAQYLDYKRQFPQIAYILLWNSWPGSKMSLVDTKNSNKLLQNERVIVLG